VMFLQLAVGGHLLLFVVRTKRSLFQPPYPSARLFWAIVATQVVAVAICLLGIGVSAIPPAAIVAVWIYCLIWMVVLDALKLVYWHFVTERERVIARQHTTLSA
jgi:H+-transporting ATPase